MKKQNKLILSFSVLTVLLVMIFYIINMYFESKEVEVVDTQKVMVKSLVQGIATIMPTLLYALWHMRKKE